MNEFNWRIESVDADTASMVVTFAYKEHVVSYNLPMPPANEELNNWIKMYAPIHDWQRMGQADKLAQISPGMEGTGTFGEAPDVVASEQPVTIGSWSEEYMRALIYQILEEIQENSV